MSENSARLNTTVAQLAKVGVTDAARMAMRLSEYPAFESQPAFIEELAIAADPNLALLGLFNLLSSVSHQQLQVLASDAGVRARFLIVAGASTALADFIAKHPTALQMLSDEAEWDRPRGRTELVRALLNGLNAKEQNGRWLTPDDSIEIINQMRVLYRRELLGIAIRDLAGAANFETTAAELSWLADAVIEAATAIAWAGINSGQPKSRLAVIAMGKSGGQELNYISDVDVIFVAAPATEAAEDYLSEATKVAARSMQICEEPAGELPIWQVDPNLRPEGKAGALVRSLEGHLAYYQKWAETWEYQALLKARAAAGDADLGNQYVEAVLPYVWEASNRPNFVADVQSMRQRVISNIPAKDLERQLKLGIGGLRDVEFAVQLLQLVHGRTDVMLRSSNTLQALEALANWGYVGREDASTMANVYKFERTLEHRIQIFQMRRTHLVPESETELRRIGRSIGYRADPAKELERELRKHRQDARRLHEKLFYRPLLNSVARLDASEARLSQDAAGARLQALGFVDPETALRHLGSLTQGVSRRAAIQKTLLPVMLQWMAETPSPDLGLLGFKRVSDALGATPWYLRLLRDESVVAERMAKLLSVSRYFTELLLRNPEGVAILAETGDIQPRTYEEILYEMQSVANRQDSASSAVAAIRTVRHRELIRISAASLLNVGDFEKTAFGLSDLTDATVAASLEAVMKHHFNSSQPSLDIAVIALGRWGGRELNFASDADAMFVYEALAENAASDALVVVSTLQQLLLAPGVDPGLELDLDLRPEGKQGAIARSLDSYQKYYARWSLSWESQALLRARVAGGNTDLGNKLISIIDSIRYPENGIDESALREIRRIKARVESERLPRGADPNLHVKLGPGGISDVEWSAQILQLQRAWRVPGLKTVSTEPTLLAAVEAGLIGVSDKQQLLEAWNLASAIRNANLLITGKASDSVPSNPNDLKLLAFVLHYENGSELADTYRKLTRRSRKIMQEIVYGDSH
ncbi:MAG: hypothetical protein RL038_515 [Actinomycetota bacterium]